MNRLGTGSVGSSRVDDDVAGTQESGRAEATLGDSAATSEQEGFWDDRRRGVRSLVLAATCGRRLATGSRCVRVER
jgi:hypothetical protein